MLRISEEKAPQTHMTPYTSQKEIARIQHRNELQASHDLLRYALLATRNNGTYEEDYPFPNASTFEELRLNEAKERYLRNNPAYRDILQNLRIFSLPYENKLIVTFCSEADFQDFYRRRVNTSNNGGTTK